MTLKAVENEYHDPADKQDQITLEQIRDAEGENVENIAPTTKRGQKKRKQPELDDMGSAVQVSKLSVEHYRNTKPHSFNFYFYFHCFYLF